MEEQKDLQQNTPIDNPPVADPLEDIIIPRVRTYKSDISQTVNQDKITTAKILIAEQKKKEKEDTTILATSIKKPTNILALVFGVIFIIGAIGSIGFFGYTRLTKEKEVAPVIIESFFLFAFDEQVPISVQKTKGEIFQLVENASQQALQSKTNTYIDLVFYKTDQATKGTSKITTAEFFNLYEINIPTSISRSFSKDFVYGLYKTDTTVEPFIVVGLVDYESAFDAMFAWEPTLALDVKDFFPELKRLFATNQNQVPLEVSTTTSTSTATSTSSVATSTLPQPINRNVQFLDVVLSNKDTRALRDNSGNPYFYYTFIDKDKILFAQDPRLITEIGRKIKEKQLVR